MKEFVISFKFLGSSNPMQQRVFAYNLNTAYTNLKNQYPYENVIITGGYQV